MADTEFYEVKGSDKKVRDVRKYSPKRNKFKSQISTAMRNWASQSNRPDTWKKDAMWGKD